MALKPFFYTIFMLLISGLLHSHIGIAQPLHYTSFESFENGQTFTRDDLEQEGFNVPWVNGFNQNRGIIDNDQAANGERSLRVLFPAEGVGPSESGAQAPLEVPAADEYYISYKMRFSDQFSWGGANEGGKLPGLAGGDRCSGCSTCDGTNGFSSRLMWRAGGRAVLYLYHMDKAGNCGDDIQLHTPDQSELYFDRGQWYTVAQRVKINSDGNADGEVEIWINGEQALFVDGLRFVSNDDKVDNLYFSTFHGGSGSDWAPGADCYMWYDDIVISTEVSDVLEPLCEAPEPGDDRNLCGTDGSITLSAGIDATNRTFSWTRDGEPVGQGHELVADQPGLYRVTAETDGCISSGEVIVSDHLSPDLGDDHVLCASTEVVLDAGVHGSGLSYAWFRNNEVMASQDVAITVNQPGTYEVIVSGEGCTSAADEAEVVSQLLKVQHDTLCESGTVSLSVDGQSGYAWFANPTGGQVLQTGLTYEPEVMETTTFYVEDTISERYSIGKETSGPEYYHNTTYDERMQVFDVLQEVTIDAVTVFTDDGGGDVEIIVENQAGEEQCRGPVATISGGKNVVPVNCTLLPGENYRMRGEGDVRLRHDNENSDEIMYPYEVDGVLSIHGTEPAWMAGQPWWMYFYNWQISTGDGLDCARTPVHAIVDAQHEGCTVTGLEKVDNAAPLHVHPNPFDHVIYINSSHEIPSFTWTITDSRGKKVKSGLSFSGEIDTSSLPRGFYIINVVAGGIQVSEKMIKQ